jgi:(p)ppGpp synthase/HD superfamily hydrolase
MITTVNAVDLAIATAIQYHNGQTNKHDGEAYITHVHRVAMHVRDRGLDETHQAVAWLHDTLEDTALTVGTLNAAFPPEIVAAVIALTKTGSLSNMDYYHSLRFNPIAARVKISDIIDNFSRNH